MRIVPAPTQNRVDRTPLALAAEIPMDCSTAAPSARIVAATLVTALATANNT
jgi:hypothetical protein